LPQVDGEAIEGTGLGLTVARSLVRGLGGEITLGNRAGGGLRVSISLPSRPERASDNGSVVAERPQQIGKCA